MEIRRLSEAERQARGVGDAYRAAFATDQPFLYGYPFRGSDPVINCGADTSPACQARLFPHLLQRASSIEPLTFYAISTSAPDDFYELTGAPDGSIFEHLAWEVLRPYFDIHLFSTTTAWRVLRETLSGFVIYCDEPAACSEMVDRILRDAAIVDDIRDRIGIEDCEPFWRDHSDIIIRAAER